MIDFTNMPTRKKAYAGANGGKIAIVYKDEQYISTSSLQERTASKR